MKTSWPRWQTWGEADWGVLLRCVWLIPAVELSVRWRSPRHWLPAIAEAAELGTHNPAIAATAAEAVRWVDAAYRRSPFRPTCLTRSLVLYRILRARGIPCRLEIGLRKRPELEGHAWVEPAGAASEAAGFEVILSF